MTDGKFDRDPLLLAVVNALQDAAVRSSLLVQHGYLWDEIIIGTDDSAYNCSLYLEPLAQAAIEAVLANRNPGLANTSEQVTENE